MLKEYLNSRNISIKALSDGTGIAYSTVNFIVNHRTPIEKCNGETLYKIANYLKISMDELYEMNRKYTMQDFEVFKSEVAHSVKAKSQLGFILETIESREIERLWACNRRIQSLYLLSMVDYLSRINEIPQCKNYDEIRSARLDPILIPLSKKMEMLGDESGKIDYDECIPEFLSHGIVEGDVLDVY